MGTPLPNPDLLVRIVDAQMQQDALEPPASADLLLVKLDKHGMSVRKVARMPGDDALVAQMAGQRSAA